VLAKAGALTNTDPQTAVLANAGLIHEAKARPRAEAQTFPKVSAKTDPAAEAEPGTEAGTAAEAETEI
jgi:hypothetical protein